MSHRLITNLLAGAIVLIGGAALSRPAAASEAARPDPCLTQLAEAAEAGHQYCLGQGFDSSSTKGKCVNGQLTEVTVRCWNA